MSYNPLVNQVKAHALAHYADGGWDVVVEAWTDAEIAEQIGRATTLRGALAKFADIVDIWSERQAEAAMETAAARGGDTYRPEDIDLQSYTS